MLWLAQERGLRWHTTIGDGRSEVARSERRYDQIQIGFTDTFSPNAAHAFALTENQVGRPVFNAIARRDAQHPVEDVGRRLRGMMSWIETEF